MSLIINMLKDLENRQNPGKSLPPIATNKQNPRSSISKHYRLIAATTFAMLSVSFAVYMVKHSGISTPIANMLTDDVTEKTAAKENKAEEAWVSQVLINSASIQKNKDNTEVIFALSHPALYHFSTDEEHNKLTLQFENAKITSTLPPLAYQNTSIKGVETSVVNDKTQFTFTLQPHTSLKSATLDTNKKTPELVLIIENHEPAQTDLTAKYNSAVKKPALQTIIIEQYKNAVKSAEQGNQAGAIKSLAKLLTTYPEYNDARVSLAAIVLQAGDTSKASTLINEGLRITPDYLPLVELKARLLTSEGKINEALNLLQSEQPLITDYPSYHAFIAALFSQQNNHQLAANIYRQLVKINPHEGSWWFGLGVSLDKLGNNKDAVFAYTKAATEGRINSSALAFLQNRLQTLQGESNVAE